MSAKPKPSKPVPSALATAFATVDFPAPAGPSMAMEKCLRICNPSLEWLSLPAQSISPLASAAMAWAKMRTLSIIFSMSMYSSGM